jgi:hypothetical protein
MRYCHPLLNCVTPAYLDLVATGRHILSKPLYHKISVIASVILYGHTEKVLEPHRGIVLRLAMVEASRDSSRDISKTKLDIFQTFQVGLPKGEPTIFIFWCDHSVFWSK